MKFYVTPTPWIRYTWGGVVGVKFLISIIVCSQTLFYKEIVRGHRICLLKGVGGSFITQKMSSEKTSVMEETVVMVMAEKHLPEPPPPCSTLDLYEKTPIFIPVDIADDVI